MPCRSDYMEPTQREAELQRTARLLVFVLARTSKGTKFRPNKKLLAAAEDQYCTDDYVPRLCEILSGLSEKDMNEIVYDGRNEESRDLADWWDTHKKADAKREKKEKAARAKFDALQKLTADEIQALGLNKMATDLRQKFSGPGTVQYENGYEFAAAGIKSGVYTCKKYNEEDISSPDTFDEEACNGFWARLQDEFGE